MAVSLFLNKIQVDISPKPITRKIQIGDVGDIDARKSSFSYTIKLPRTSRNIEVLEMLGVIGNESRKPYETIACDYVVDGVYLVENGFAVVKSTSGTFDLNIIDGVKGLAELLKGKKIADLPLDDLNHILTTQEYIDSYSRTEGFIYGIADYGRGVSSSVKVEKQAPSIFTHTLFRRIFESNGLTLQGEFFTTNEKYLNEVVTPSRGYEITPSSLVSDAKGGADTNVLSDYQTSNDWIDFEEKFTFTDSGLVGASVVSGDIVFSVAGTYKLNLDIFSSLYLTYAYLKLKINGSSKAYFNLPDGNSQNIQRSVTFAVEAGDVVQLWIEGSSGIEEINEPPFVFEVNYSANVDTNLFLQTGGQLIVASDYIGDIEQLAFIKDVINRYGLVLHPVQGADNYRFKRLEALLNDREGAEDWTGKVSKINSEGYNSGYAQTNKANYVYPEATVVPTHDGEMTIENKNAEIEKTFFSSPFEVPVAANSVNGNEAFKIPIWGEESGGTVVIETELTEDSEALDNYLLNDGEAVRLTPDFQIADKYISNTGSLTSDSDSDIDVFEISSGEKRNVVSYLTGTNIAVYAFYEDSDLTTLVSVGTVHASGSDKYDEVLTAPASANYVAISKRFEDITSDNRFNPADYIDGEYLQNGSGQSSVLAAAARTDLIQVEVGQHLFFDGSGDFFSLHTYSGASLANWIAYKGAPSNYVVESGVTHIAMTVALSDGGDYSGTFQINLDSLKAYDSYVTAFVQNKSFLYLSDVAGTDSEGWVVKKFENIDPINKAYKASGSVEFSGAAFVCFYDISDNFISYYYSGSGTLVDLTKNSLSVPTNCKAIRVSAYGTQDAELYQYEDVEFDVAINEETPLKITSLKRIDTSITAKLFDEVTGITVSEDVPFLSLDFISLQYFLSNFYKAFQSMIENYKDVQFEMNLSVIDVFNLDFFKLKYLKQTGRFYYLNTVQHRTGRLSKVNMIEISDFPANQPPSQVGSYSFSLNHSATRTITLSNLLTDYEDPELDAAKKIKIISGFNSEILIKQNGVTITAETEINVEDLALTVTETIGGLAAYSKIWIFAIADIGSGTYGTQTGTLTANVQEVINQPPVANAGADQNHEMPPEDLEFEFEDYVYLNGSASYDNTGDIVSYSWEIQSKPAASSAYVSQVTTTPTAYLILPVEAESVGTYTMKLTVTDEYGLTDTDTMTVQVTIFEIPV